MADLAAVFGWPPSELQGMAVDELMAWRDEAEARSRAANED
jgi:hypothetical protein